MVGEVADSIEARGLVDTSYIRRQKLVHVLSNRRLGIVASCVLLRIVVLILDQILLWLLVYLSSGDGGLYLLHVARCHGGVRLLVLFGALALLEVALVVLLDLLDCLDLFLGEVWVAAVSGHDLILDILGEVLVIVIVELVEVVVTLHSVIIR